MPARKTKQVDPSARLPPAEAAEPKPFFPFARYTSVVGVHTSLLAWDFTGASRDAKPPRDIMQSLTENPVRTVAWLCVGAALLQSWWASWLHTWATEDKLRKLEPVKDIQAKLERKAASQWDPERIQAYGRAAATTFAGSIAFYIVTILFGAPILSPALVSRLTWVRLFAELSCLFSRVPALPPSLPPVTLALSPRTPVERALVYPAVGAVMGCWAGAIPIGLDWERPWQAWPLPPTFGAVGGYIAGSLAALAVSGTLELAQAGLSAAPETAPATKKKPKKA
ncbi:GPI biosynthesis protein family Pig-F-domain-containing protein [Epithele typhae]|uniref:GPI biosynthesis protein family Pig-F-domain-containing protein n=1 Tax=Epithele typhae TaxID=378194 RepID=UPI002007D5BA|nr:GPI biosynthesis protein family Pig-F-domain-containing protein [Epithele typhae]KAH9929100.1 GPI biosynthesis protein family Pig-F-domain-containing protein [Epithele typhae]